MPVLTLKLVEPVDQQQARQASMLLTDLTETILCKKRELTAVIIEPVRADLWSIGEVTMSDTKLATFALDIKLTLATNTPSEKAAYVKAVFDGMQTLLGPLQAASYVIIGEVEAAAWGYGGRTQADRFAAQAAS
jgi:4-oxalocrotonate tautomerase